MDLIIIFLAKNGKLFLDHTDPLRLELEKAQLKFEYMT